MTNSFRELVDHFREREKIDNDKLKKIHEAVILIQQNLDECLSLKFYDEEVVSCLVAASEFIDDALDRIDDILDED